MLHTVLVYIYDKANKIKALLICHHFLLAKATLCLGCWLSVWKDNLVWMTRILKMRIPLFKRTEFTLINVSSSTQRLLLFDWIRVGARFIKLAKFKYVNFNWTSHTTLVSIVSHRFFERASAHPADNADWTWIPANVALIIEKKGKLRGKKGKGTYLRKLFAPMGRKAMGIYRSHAETAVLQFQLQENCWTGERES